MKTIVVNFLRNLAVRILSGLAGWQLMLAQFFVKRLTVLGRYAGELLKYNYEHQVNEAKKAEDAKKAKEYDETLKDGATEQAQQDAVTDLLNSGHK